MAGAFLFIAAFCVRFVDDKDDVVGPSVSYAQTRRKLAIKN